MSDKPDLDMDALIERLNKTTPVDSGYAEEARTAATALRAQQEEIARLTGHAQIPHDLLADVVKGHLEIADTPGSLYPLGVAAERINAYVAIKQRAQCAEAERDALRDRLHDRNDAVIEWCGVLDAAGTAFKFDPVKDHNSTDYFMTVSKNAGLARVVCEQDNAAIDAARAKEQKC